MEKQSELIGLRLTKQEYDAVKSKAGLAAVATYIRHVLNTETDIFK